MKRKNISDIVFVEHRSKNGNKINIPIDFLVDEYDEISEHSEQLKSDIATLVNQAIKINDEYKSKNNQKDISIELLNLLKMYCVENSFDNDKKVNISLGQILDDNNLLENFLGFINNKFDYASENKGNKSLLFRYALLQNIINKKRQLISKINDYNLMEINEIKEKEKTKSSR